ncbi:D-alanine--D-alanine ligase family protein, partial [Treponema sp. R6D11]
IALNHTTEEILAQIKNSGFTDFTCTLKNKIKTALEAENIAQCKPVETKCIPLDEFLAMTKQQDADIFICLHGGIGENGELQEMLEQRGIHFNGSGSQASKLCIDKYDTGQRIDSLGIANLRSCKKKKVKAEEINVKEKSAETQWKELCEHFNGDTIVVKPNSDGCSTGIAVLRSQKDLLTYYDVCADTP